MLFSKASLSLVSYSWPLAVMLQPWREVMLVWSSKAMAKVGRSLPSGRRILRARRRWVMMSPLSLTVVSWSSRRITAFTSSAYFFCGAAARLCSQSGTDALAVSGNKFTRNKNTIALIPFLSISPSTQDRLLFVAGLYFIEEIFQLSVVLLRKPYPIDPQFAFGDELRAIKLAAAVVDRIRQSRMLLRRCAFQRMPRRHLDCDCVHFRQRVRQVNRKFTRCTLERVLLLRLKEIRRKQQALASGGSVRRYLDIEVGHERFAGPFPAFRPRHFYYRSVRQPVPQLVLEAL